MKKNLYSLFSYLPYQHALTQALFQFTSGKCVFSTFYCIFRIHKDGIFCCIQTWMPV